MVESGFVRCPSCGILVHDPQLDLLRTGKAAPCCGAAGESREGWPSLQAIKLLEVADAQDRTSQDGQRVAVLFFASALEAMLEDLLVEVLRDHSSSEALRDAVLDGYEGVARRKQLFKRLSGRKLGDILSELWGQEFLADWERLSTRRNRIAHGSYYFPDSTDVLLMERLSGSMFKALAELNNAVTGARPRAGGDAALVPDK